MTTAGMMLFLLLAETPSTGLIPFGTKSETAATAAREAMSLLVRRPFDGRAIHGAAQRAVDADADFALGHQLLAIAFELGDDSEAAGVQAARAKELAAKAPSGERRLIEALHLRDPLDESVAAWKSLAADFPGEALVHLRLGQRLFARFTRAAPAGSTADLEQARASLATALRQEAESSSALRMLVDTFVQTEDYAGARAVYEQAGADRFGVDIALLFLFEGKGAEARARLAQVAEKTDPGAPVARWNHIAHTQLEAGDAEGALASYERGFASMKAGDRSEKDRQVWTGRYHHGRGRCLARLGKHQEAWAEVETVKRMIDGGGEEGAPFLPAWHFLAGYVKLEAGENQAALEHLEQAGPQHDPHRTLLMAQAAERLGDKAGARKRYEQVVSRERVTVDGAAAFAPARARLAALAVEAPGTP